MNKASVYSRYCVGYGDSNKVSCVSGDGYIKDKEANLRPGTAHRLNAQPGSDNRPHTPHSVENYGAQASNRSGDKTPPEVAMEMNKRTSGEIPESGNLDHCL